MTISYSIIFWEVSPIIVKDVKNVEKSQFWSRSRGFCQIFYDFGFGFKKFGIGKKYRFRFRKNLVSEKSLGFGFGKFGIVKKVSVSVSVKILVSSFSVPEWVLWGV